MGVRSPHQWARLGTCPVDEFDICEIFRYKIANLNGELEMKSVEMVFCPVQKMVCLPQKTVLRTPMVFKCREQFHTTEYGLRNTETQSF